MHSAIHHSVKSLKISHVFKLGLLHINGNIDYHLQNMRLYSIVDDNKINEPTPDLKLSRMDHEINRANKLKWRELAKFISGSQTELRSTFQNRGEKYSDELWQKRVEDKDFLKKYADNMQTLATEYWITKNMNSRISWVYNQIKEYFFNGVMEVKVEKEQRKVNHFPEFLNHFEEAKEKLKQTQTTNSQTKVLDVGSCYNPFSNYSDLDITAIDLYPAVQEVKECDFLKLNIFRSEEVTKEFAKRKLGDSTSIGVSDKRMKCDTQNFDKEKQTFVSTSQSLENDDRDFVPECVQEMEAETFDVVIFSLFISYIPSPRLRFLCCVKAYELLRPNGILCIVTPDSRNLNSNVHIIKLWKVTLGFLGFQRIKYQKHTNFHGMVFRKALCKDVWAADAQKDIEAMKLCQVREKYKNINYDDVPHNIYIAGDFHIDNPKKV